MEAIPEEAWTPVPYWMDGAADVAETTCTPFASEPDAAPVRLIVRRVRPTPGSQLALFAKYRYHAFITGREGEMLELEADHRRHAGIENAIRDLKYGVGLNHLPSGRFASPELAEGSLAGGTGHGPQSGPLDGPARPGRADRNHQDPPATPLLPRRETYPLGAPPHSASPPALAVGRPVQPRLGPAASHSTVCLTLPKATDPPSSQPMDPANWLQSGTGWSPGACSPAGFAQRRRRGPPLAPRTATADHHRPHLLESATDRRAPMPLTLCSNAKTASLRWIRAKRTIARPTNEVEPNQSRDGDARCSGPGGGGNRCCETTPRADLGGVGRGR